MQYTITKFNSDIQIQKENREYKIIGGDDYNFEPVNIFASESNILLLDAYRLAQRYAEENKNSQYRVQLMEIRLDTARVDDFSRVGLAVEIVESDVNVWEEGHPYLYRAEITWNFKDILYFSYVKNKCYSTWSSEMRIPCLTRLFREVGNNFYSRYPDAPHVGGKNV